MEVLQGRDVAATRYPSFTAPGKGGEADGCGPRRPSEMWIFVFGSGAVQSVPEAADACWGSVVDLTVDAAVYRENAPQISKPWNCSQVFIKHQ